MKILTASASAAITFFRCAELTGEPVIFPTDTIYGMGAPLQAVEANERIYAIKGRPAGRAMPVLAAGYEQLWSLAEQPSGDIIQWLDLVWPGDYTVVFRAKENVNSLYCAGGNIAVRLLPYGWLREAVECVGPVTATSVNLSGNAPLIESKAIEAAFGSVCKFMLWGESGISGSKIVDVTDGSLKIIRN